MLGASFGIEIKNKVAHVPTVLPKPKESYSDIESFIFSFNDITRFFPYGNVKSKDHKKLRRQVR